MTFILFIGMVLICLFHDMEKIMMFFIMVFSPVNTNVRTTDSDSRSDSTER